MMFIPTISTLKDENITSDWIAIEELAVKYFAKYQPNLMLGNIAKEFQKNLSHVESTNDDEIQKLIKVVDKFLIEYLNGGDHEATSFGVHTNTESDKQDIRFGSFLTNFIPLKNFKSFVSTSKTDCFQWDNGCDYDYDYDSYDPEPGPVTFGCGALDENEIFIHGLFSALSTLIGFDKTNNISLFDVPSILADIDHNADLTLRKLHPFLFTRCQREDETQLFDFYDCVEEWNLYLESKGSSEISEK